MRKHIRLTALLLAILTITILCSACRKESKAEEGEKSVTVSVYMDSLPISTATFLTKQEFLLGALKEALITESDEDPLVTVCGITIDPSKKQVWLITKDGEPVETSVSATPLENGDRYEITLSVTG